MKTKYLLIGGGLAAGEAAKQIRQRDEQGTITLVGGELHRPYDRPPLSKEFLRGEKAQAQLYFDSEESFRTQRIDLILGNAVQKLDVSSRRAQLAHGEAIQFEKALLATGGRPVPLKIPGADLGGVHYLRTIEDSAAIAADGQPGKHAILIGAGFIGLEVAASLTQRGVSVTVLEAQSRIWPRFAAPTVAQFVQDYCHAKGVQFVTNETATTILGKDRVTSIMTRSGTELPCDFVGIGIGIVPNVELAKEAGLQVGNGIVVNEYLESSAPGIYAAGDIANFPDPYAGTRRRVEHWGHAEYSGQLAGQNMAGEHQPYELLSYVWSDIFDLHLEFAGDESAHDQVLVRGRLEEKRFMVLYLQRQVLRAYFGVNANAKDFPSLQKLIKQRKDLSGKLDRLQDPAVPIKTLAT
jgi:3-phenylpropionate/trans-cinnamate dioxygenase ferredoxin reductase component